MCRDLSAGPQLQRTCKETKKIQQPFVGLSAFESVDVQG